MTHTKEINITAFTDKQANEKRNALEMLSQLSVESLQILQKKVAQSGPAQYDKKIQKFKNML
jgi:hypothetical protein